jgi:hypothetical protein
MKKLAAICATVLALAFAAPIASACPGHDEKVTDDKPKAESTEKTADKAKTDKNKKADQKDTKKAEKAPATSKPSPT